MEVGPGGYDKHPKKDLQAGTANKSVGLGVITKWEKM